MTETHQAYFTKPSNGRVWVFNEETLNEALALYSATTPDGHEQVQIIRAFLESDAAKSTGLTRMALPES
jgi:hypothetical protein